MHLNLQKKGISTDTRSVQENFNLITSFIQDSADKHIPSKTSRSVSSVPWITPAIRRKIRRKTATYAKAKKSGSAKIRAKFETLRREIRADIRKQHDLNVNNLVGDVKANPKDFYRYINSQKMDAQRDVINDCAKILDNKGQVDTFILDFEKAFDTPPPPPPHELLKSKLFSYGIVVKH